MKIAFLCNEYPPSLHGGIGSVVQLLARAMVRSGHEVRVVGAYANMPTELEAESDCGVQVFRLRLHPGRFGWLQARYRIYRTLARWCQQKKVDLVELPDWEGWAAGWPLLPVPITVRFNGSATFFAADLQQRVARLTYVLEWASLRRADFWCACSEFTAERTRQLFGLAYPITVLPNPVEGSAYVPLAARVPNQVVFTGTLTPKKGVVSLIDAWPQIAGECPTAELHLYGKDGKTADGEPMQAHLQSRLPGDVASRVTFHGHVSRPKVLEALRTARVAVFPSYSEAFGLAPVEAMSCGCPTIYSMCGPGREIGEDGRDLLLIDPANPADIARAVARVLSSDELAGTLSLNGWQRVQNAFLLERQVEQNVEFYTQCCNQFHGLQCA